jgi:gentisate 1,2-dioxygenase
MFGHGLTPVEVSGSSLKRYPYKRAREAIAHLLKTNQIDRRWGAKLEYRDPSSGGSILPAITAFLQGLPKGFKSQRRKTTETTLLVLVEGAATVKAGEAVYHLKPKDIVLVPSWEPLVIESTQETIIFSVSNKPLLDKLDLWREEMG